MMVCSTCLCLPAPMSSHSPRSPVRMFGNRSRDVALEDQTSRDHTVSTQQTAIDGELIAASRVEVEVLPPGIRLIVPSDPAPKRKGATDETSSPTSIHFIYHTSNAFWVKRCRTRPAWARCPPSPPTNHRLSRTWQTVQALKWWLVAVAFVMQFGSYVGSGILLQGLVPPRRRTASNESRGDDPVASGGIGLVAAASSDPRQRSTRGSVAPATTTGAGLAATLKPVSTTRFYWLSRSSHQPPPAPRRPQHSRTNRFRRHCGHPRRHHRGSRMGATHPRQLHRRLAHQTPVGTTTQYEHRRHDERIQTT